jgi:hypothetical protein
VVARRGVGRHGRHPPATSFDPRTGHTQAVAGTRTEGLGDGPLLDAWFAQPSGLAPDGDRLWLVDAETSALRWVEDGHVHTAVGTGLFDFGFRDGDPSSARLQHPLGVLALADGAVAVADTHNGAVRRFDPGTGRLTTLAAGLSEPTQLLVSDNGLLVVESAAHRLLTLGLGSRARATDEAETAQRPATAVPPGPVTLVVAFTPPAGQALDDRYGPPTWLTVSATPAALLREGDGTSRDLSRPLVLDPAVGGGVLHIAAAAAACATGDAEGAACHLHQQDWGIPVVLDDEAPDVLRLSLGTATESEPLD